MIQKTDGFEIDPARGDVQARLTTLHRELQQAVRVPPRGTRRRPGLRSVAAIEQDIAAVQEPRNRRVNGHAEKRARALERLSRPDAGALSDRAIARDLGLSQPFIGALRRRLAAGATVDALLRRHEAPGPRERRAADNDVLGGAGSGRSSDDVLGSDDVLPPGDSRTVRLRGQAALDVMMLEKFGYVPKYVPVDDDDRTDRAITDYDPFEL